MTFFLDQVWDEREIYHVGVGNLDDRGNDEDPFLRRIIDDSVKSEGNALQKNCNHVGFLSSESIVDDSNGQTDWKTK